MNLRENHRNMFGIPKQARRGETKRGCGGGAPERIKYRETTGGAGAEPPTKEEKTRRRGCGGGATKRIKKKTMGLDPPKRICHQHQDGIKI